MVKELPKTAEPLSLAYIAQKLDLPLKQVGKIVDELEMDKTFLFRNNSEHINWAYPVTVDHTPHRVTFSTGEQVNAA